MGAPQTGFVSHTTCASCTSLVSAKALEPFPLVSLLVIGFSSHVSGWQSYLGLGLSRSPIVYVSQLFYVNHLSQSLRFGSAGDRCYCLASLRRLSRYYADWLARTSSARFIVSSATVLLWRDLRLLSASVLGARWKRINSPYVCYWYDK